MVMVIGRHLHLAGARGSHSWVPAHRRRRHSLVWRLIGVLGVVMGVIGREGSFGLSLGVWASLLLHRHRVRIDIGMIGRRHSITVDVIIVIMILGIKMRRKLLIWWTLSLLVMIVIIIVIVSKRSVIEIVLMWGLLLIWCFLV